MGGFSYYSMDGLLLTKLGSTRISASPLDDDRLLNAAGPFKEAGFARLVGLFLAEPPHLLKLGCGDLFKDIGLS